MSRIAELRNRLRGLNAEIDYLQTEADGAECEIESLERSGRNDWTCLNCECDVKENAHFCTACTNKVRALFEQGFSIEKIANGRPETIIFLATTIGAEKLQTVGGEK